MPISTAAFVSAGVAALQLGAAAKQWGSGVKLEKAAKRPTMDIPREIYNKLSSADIAAIEGMSAEERKQYIDNLQRNANFQLAEMGTRKAGLVGAAELGQTQADAMRNLAVESEKMRRENQRYLGQVQSEMAGWKQQQFDINKMQPYMAQVTAAQAMKGAAMQNAFNALQSTANNIAATQIYGNAMKGKKLPKTSKKTPPVGGPPIDDEPGLAMGGYDQNTSNLLDALKATNPALYNEMISNIG